MQDGFRYFISRPTGPNGDPVPMASSQASYYRVWNNGFEGIPSTPASYWDGSAWRSSMFPTFNQLLDDVLGSGATIRELLDPAEVPNA